MTLPDRDTFQALASRGNLVPLVRRLMSDQLTPVLAYRRLVAPDERAAPSFLFESVESGQTVGRHSFLGAQPWIEVVARRHDVTITDHRAQTVQKMQSENPLDVPRAITASWRPVRLSAAAGEGGSAHLPAFVGGWVGYAGYDTVRYLEPKKLPFESAPRDDRALPEMHFGLYRQAAVFDHVEKVLYAVHHVLLDEHDSIDAAYDEGCAELGTFVSRLETHSVPLPAGSIEMNLSHRPVANLAGNSSRDEFESAVAAAKQYIAAGDAFQVVLSQRFERQTTADPFEIYRALRVVNPSPYMIYLQAEGSILVASSPEILCRVRDRLVTNRPLAGTRKRGATDVEDQALEKELLSDEKERAEHVMLVDLGRNDLGQVCEVKSIQLERVMEVERYSHVMHLSSTLTGRLRDKLDCWEALRRTLPVGTVSGAPKIRAMQIIDELEPTRRGPYAGGIGFVSFHGDMDMALALRTMVVPTGEMPKRRNAETPKSESGAFGHDPPAENRIEGERVQQPRWQWTVHLQAGAGIVADSVPASEYEETVNKAAALGRAIDLAERAFVNST